MRREVKRLPALRRLFESALAAATLSSCLFGRSTGPYERDEVVPLDPAFAKRELAGNQGKIDEDTCRRACKGVSGEFRHCRFSTRNVETPAVLPVVLCYRFPEDGGKEEIV